MGRKKCSRRNTIFGIAVSVVAAVLIGAIAFGAIAVYGNDAIDYRPEFCDNNRCVPDEVFEKLPDYPEDFYDKWVLIYLNKLTDNSIIEEQYWRQPDFYADSFKQQGVQYYNGEKRTRNSAGSGPYPADIGAGTIKPGGSTQVTTFWHATWGVVRYQVFSLVPEYPENMTIRMSDTKISQDPETAEKCLIMETTPEYILLEPTWPYFHYNWTRKVTARIAVSQDCPPGVYGVQLVPGDPIGSVSDDLEYEVGLTRLSSMRVGGAWQIVLNVAE